MFVAPYRISGARGKNDAADAAAICEAMQRLSMRFMPPKSIDQQARLTVHRARQGFVEARTACINRIHGLLSAPSARSKHEILDRVFSDEQDVQPDAVEVLVHHLRKRLHGTPVCIRTVRGLGYVLEPTDPVSERT